MALKHINTDDVGVPLGVAPLGADNKVPAIHIPVAAEYTHVQSVASAVWNIPHSLGKFPSITVVDSGNNIVWGAEQYIDNNNIQITFGAAFTGKAYLN